MRRVYLDHAATTPVDPEVAELMAQVLREVPGNPSSIYAEGRRARALVDRARDEVAAAIGAEPAEIVFTSGGTEADNLALRGVLKAREGEADGIVTTSIEHHAILDTAHDLEAHGQARVTVVGVDRDGRVSPDALRAAIDARTAIVSVMHGNNEIGTLQPIEVIGALCKERGVPFHSDAVQTVGALEIDVRALPVDLLSVNAHKFYGPKGVGALYVRKKNPRVRLTPLLDGGGHEQGFRSGTLNVPGIVGVGAACELAMLEMAQESPRLARLRDRLQTGIMSRVDGVTVNGNEAHRLPHVTNLSFASVEGEQLLATVTRDLAVSSGSACTSASMEPSFVLKAIGVPTDFAYASIRFSLGKTNDAAQIDFAIENVVECVNRLRHAAAIV